MKNKHINELTPAELNNLNPHVWADESFKIAESFVYAGVEEDEALSAAYI